jgi:tellurite resistance protein
MSKLPTTSGHLSFGQLSEVQISVWLRGLTAIALADQNFSAAEKNLLQELTGNFSDAPEEFLVSSIEPITPLQLAMGLGNDPGVADDFLRTAVAIALADGDYSDTEHQIIQQFCTALKREVTVMSEMRATLGASADFHPDLLAPVKDWLEQIKVQDPRLARLLCKAIPAQCPFERDLFVFGRKVAHIPAMCKINPVYDQLVGLRFRALSYLVDECHEDVSAYC